jgi:hypothetical protein
MLGVCAAGSLSGLGRALVADQTDQVRAVLAAHSPPIASTIVIQADLTAVATGPLATAIRCQLESMADLESSGAATVYRFSEPSLNRAFDAGRTAGEIGAFLHAHATKGVPQPLAYLVEDVGRRHGRVRVGTAGCYVRSDDPSLLAEIMVARRAAKLGLRQLAPTVLVSAATTEAVFTTLRGAGYLPAAEDDTGAFVVRRREVGRATGGYGSAFARQSRTTRGGGQVGAGRHDRPGQPGSADTGPGEQRELERLVRALRARPVSGSPPQASPRRVNGDVAGATSGTPSPFSQLDLLRAELPRPAEIAKTRIAIVELLALSLENEWMLRLEYTNKQGRSQQVRAAVLDVAADLVTIGTMPGYGVRTLNIGRITWARAMTEAEEGAL